MINVQYGPFTAYVDDNFNTSGNEDILAMIEEIFSTLGYWDGDIFLQTSIRLQELLPDATITTTIMPPPNFPYNELVLI